MSRLLSYEPRSVLIPADAGVERAYDGYDLTPAELALCDLRTVFSDVFLSADDKELLCIGPPFANIGRPRKILKGGGGSMRFAVKEPVSGEPVALTRIGLDDDPGPELDLRFIFDDFEVNVRVAPKRAAALPPVSLVLSTTQKDNDPQWVEDWCLWHRRAHGVERIVIYDNGSANAHETYSRVARASGHDLIVVNWVFPFGSPHRHSTKFTQTVALNHCRLFFGAQARWCINLDIDEYLYNESGHSLAGFLHLRGRRPVHYLPELLVPMTTDNHPGRCFDSPVRFRAIRKHRGTKYIYRPDRVGWLDLHRARPRLNRSADEIVYGIGIAAWPPLALRRKQRLARRLIEALSSMAARAARILSNRGPVRTGIARTRDPGPLFFYHFKALNTEWKYRRAVVEAGSTDLVADPRITRMKDVLEAGHGHHEPSCPGEERRS